MLHVLALPAAFALGALGRRVAGGAVQEWTGLDVGDTPARIFYGLTIAVGAWVAGAPLAWAAALILLTWIGATTGNNGSMGMGRIAGTAAQVPPPGAIGVVAGPAGFWSGIDPAARWSNIRGMTLHGLESGVLPAAWAMALHWWLHRTVGVAWAPALAAGLLAAPCYLAGWRLSRYRGPAEGWVVIAVAGARSPTEWAELSWGALMGLGAGAAALLAV